MSEFYLEKNANESGEQLVHFSNCSALPGKEEIRYLGSIATFESARSKATNFAYKVGACTTCASQFVE